MEKKNILGGIIAIALLLIAGGVYWGFDYLSFKSLQARCVKNSYGITTIYFNISSNFSGIQSIASDTQATQNVYSVDAISADEALQNFAEAHQNNPTVLNSIKELNSNPLESSIAIKFTADEDQPKVIDYITQEASKYGVLIDTVQEGRSQIVLDEISKMPYNDYSRRYMKACVQGDLPQI